MNKLLMFLGSVAEIVISGVISFGYCLMVHWPRCLYRKINGKCVPYCRDWQTIGNLQYKCRVCGAKCDL
jgi:hypothetical protein